MRSDFWSLPWAAQQAIRKGEAAAARARRRARTINELEVENERLSTRVTELEAKLGLSEGGGNVG